MSLWKDYCSEAILSLYNYIRVVLRTVYLRSLSVRCSIVVRSIIEQRSNNDRTTIEQRPEVHNRQGESKAKERLTHWKNEPQAQRFFCDIACHKTVCYKFGILLTLKKHVICRFFLYMTEYRLCVQKYFFFWNQRHYRLTFFIYW